MAGLFNPTKAREFTLIFYTIKTSKELEEWINTTINLKRNTEVKSLKPIRGINLAKSGYFLSGSPEITTIYAVTGELGDPVYISGLVRYGWEDISEAEYAYAKNVLLGHPDVIGWIDQAVPDAKIFDYLLSEGIIQPKVSTDIQQPVIVKPGEPEDPVHIPVYKPKPTITPVDPTVPSNPVTPGEPDGIEETVKTGSVGFDPMILLIAGLAIVLVVFMKKR